jgi:hypothetical protein
MAWIFTSFLLDRHHEYWRFQVPFTAGWSYGRRANYFQTKGDIEEAHRMLRTELRTLDGEPVRIPQDLDSDWTVILFAQPGPWSSRRDDGLPPSPLGVTTGLTSFAASRPEGEVKVLLAMLGGEPAAIRENLEALIDPKRKQPGIECPVLMVPGGIANPLVHRLGILSEDNGFNSVLVSRDGRIAVALSGLVSPKSGRNAGIVGNVIEREDEKSISAMLERGDIQKAKERIFTLAPPFDPEAVDEKGRKLRPPQYSLYHLRARARVYAALKEWDKALADAEEVVQRQLGTDGGMSLRTDELDESEALRDSILEQSARSKP